MVASLYRGHEISAGGQASKGGDVWVSLPTRDWDALVSEWWWHRKVQNYCAFGKVKFFFPRSGKEGFYFPKSGKVEFHLL